MGSFMCSDCKECHCANKAALSTGGDAPTMEDLHNGKLVMKKYRMLTSIDAILGEGSFSICYRGNNLETGLPVAIKVYRGRSSGHNSKQGEIMLKKFSRQIDVLKRLQTPLVEPQNPLLWSQQLARASPADLLFQLIDYSKDELGNPSPDPDDGQMYVMTEVAQYSLLDYLRCLNEKGKLLSITAVKRITKSILLATAALHSKGLVHLDLKPENLMVFDHHIKVIDVDGCVQIGTSISIDDSSLSFSPCYCAPEWAQFLLDECDGAQIIASPMLDAWSIGLTLCELITHDAVLKSMYASFLRHGREQQEATFLFLEWLCNIDQMKLPASVTRFDTDFADFLTTSLLTQIPTNRKTPAECLSSPYFCNNEFRLTVLDEDKVRPSNRQDRQSRRVDNSTTALHKGTLWKLNSNGNPQDPAHWLQRDMWIASNGSLCYYSLKSNTRLVLLDAQHICRSTITNMTESARPYTFQVKVPSDDHAHGEDIIMFACETGEEYDLWTGKLQRVKHEVFRTVHLGGKLAHEIRQFKLTVRNRRMLIEDPSSADFKPTYRGKLWKLKADGSRMKADDWYERDMWITNNGCLAYWSKRDEKSLLYYTDSDIKRARLRKVAPEESCRPYTFQVHLSAEGGIEFAPGEFSCESDESRTMWILESEKLGAQMMATLS